MSNFELIYNAAVSLFPRARAWVLPIGGIFQKLIRGISIVFAEVKTDNEKILQTLTPYGEMWSPEIASIWERRLWLLAQEESVPLTERNNSIIDRMAFPNNVQGRGTLPFIRFILENTGFSDIKVFENRFSDGLGGVVTQYPTFLSINFFMNDMTPEYMNDSTPNNPVPMGRLGTSGASQMAVNTLLLEEGDFQITEPFTEEELSQMVFISGVEGSLQPEDAYRIRGERVAQLRYTLLTLRPMGVVFALNIKLI